MYTTTTTATADGSVGEDNGDAQSFTLHHLFLHGRWLLHFVQYTSYEVLRIL